MPSKKNSCGVYAPSRHLTQKETQKEGSLSCAHRKLAVWSGEHIGDHHLLQQIPSQFHKWIMKEKGSVNASTNVQTMKLPSTPFHSEKTWRFSKNGESLDRSWSNSRSWSTVVWYKCRGNHQIFYSVFYWDLNPPYRKIWARWHSQRLASGPGVLFSLPLSFWSDQTLTSVKPGEDYKKRVGINLYKIRTLGSPVHLSKPLLE